MITRPGKGWKQLTHPVWQHETGIRIHVSGKMILTEKGIISVSYKDINLKLLTKINGGNRKRALMAYALNYCKREAM